MITPDQKDRLSHEVLHAIASISLEMRRIEQALKNLKCDRAMIGVKDINVFNEIIAVPWHPKLIAVHEWLCERYPGQIIITSAFRGGRGMHGTDPLRAEDIKSQIFENPEKVRDDINAHWEYGKKPYKVCVYHRVAKCLKCGNKFNLKVDTTQLICPKCGAKGQDIKDYGPHFHIQVRDQTVKRQE